MAATAQLQNQAKACLAKQVEMPSALWRMIGAAVFNSADDHALLQSAVDYLTCKAKAQMAFNNEDKDFLVGLYDAFSTGGSYKSLPEAAKLADHYVHGKGVRISINAEVYKTSVIVKAAMDAMKHFISDQIKEKKVVSYQRSVDAPFLKKPYAKVLMQGRNDRTEGRMYSTGILLAEQNNSRLKNADNRFYLQAYSSLVDKATVQTRWLVENDYDFVPFDAVIDGKKVNHVTHIPLGHFTLILPDGLSHYMTKLGIAQEFKYYAEWSERWKVIGV